MDADGDEGLHATTTTGGRQMGFKALVVAVVFLVLVFSTLPMPIVDHALTVAAQLIGPR